MYDEEELKETRILNGVICGEKMISESQIRNKIQELKYNYDFTTDEDERTIIIEKIELLQELMEE